ncbi:MAG: GNAT family N-acetyltransferase, partial [Gemmatimonadota bacterium]|nr:GNAT family N-acetyltransferase [Gemmatimonadota bacterium]
ERRELFLWALFVDSRIGICRMFSCQVYANLDELASCCYLRWLGVDQEHRRQGIGHHLLNLALSEAQEEGYKRVILNCRENNIAAVSLYIRVGFRIGDVSSAYVKRL